MMRREMVAPLAIAAAAICVSSARATLIELDDPVFGAASITRDTDTNLDWLDVPISAGRAHDDVLLELGTGGDFEGFRYASAEEVEALFLIVGFQDINSTPGPNSYAPAVYLQGLVGETEPMRTKGVTDTLATSLYYAPEIFRDDDAQVAGAEIHEGNIAGDAV